MFLVHWNCLGGCLVYVIAVYYMAVAYLKMKIWLGLKSVDVLQDVRA
jgi:hypothetical protein